MFFQVRDMGEALTRDKELTLKIEGQIESMRRYRDSQNLDALVRAKFKYFFK